MTDLPSIAGRLCAPGKGILAADESVASATKRLASYGIEASPEMRRQYRELFFGTPGVEEYLSGVILFEETLLQKDDRGMLFPASLSERGILAGIKVDKGTEPIALDSKEVITQGLLDLTERLQGYKAAGGTFTKWRAVIRIEGNELPTAALLVENAKRLAQYAREVQMAGLVPMLEPEVLHEGMHSRARAKAVLREILGTLFSVLEENAVDCAGLLLKTSMVLSGSESHRKDTPEEVAADTMEILMASVPKSVAGIVFLSGGQTPDEATDNLAAISKQAKALNAPWPLTFSYARALQEEALAVWKGKPENIDAARAVFISRLRTVSAALG